MTRTETRSNPATGAVRRFLLAPFRKQTLKNLVYLALAFPLGLGYFVGLTVGGSLGVGLLITWIGLPILAGTLIAATAAASLEATLASTLVGVDVDQPAYLQQFDLEESLVVPGNGFVEAIKRLFISPSAWTSVALLLVKFGFGIASFVALVVSVTVTGALLGAPLLYDQAVVNLGTASGEAYTFGGWVIDSFPEAIAVSAVGVVSLFVAANLLNALARAQALTTASVLRTRGDAL